MPQHPVEQILYGATPGRVRVAPAPLWSREDLEAAKEEYAQACHQARCRREMWWHGVEYTKFLQMISGEHRKRLREEHGLKAQTIKGFVLRNKGDLRQAYKDFIEHYYLAGSSIIFHDYRLEKVRPVPEQYEYGIILAYEYEKEAARSSDLYVIADWERSGPQKTSIKNDYSFPLPEDSWHDWSKGRIPLPEHVLPSYPDKPACLLEYEDQNRG